MGNPARRANAIRDERDRRKLQNLDFVKKHPEIWGLEDWYRTTALTCDRFDRSQSYTTENFYLHIEVTNGGCPECQAKKPPQNTSKGED